MRDPAVVTLNLDLPSELKQQIHKAAKEAKKEDWQLIIETLEEYLKEHEQPIGGRQ